MGEPWRRIHLDQPLVDHLTAVHRSGETRAELDGIVQRQSVDLSHPGALRAHLMDAHGFTESDFHRNSHADRHPQLGPSSDVDRPLADHEMRRLHDHHDHVVYRGDFPNAVTVGDSHFHEA